MVGRVLVGTWKAARYPSVWWPCVAGALGAHWAFAAIHADRGFWQLPQSTMVVVALIVIAQFMLDLATTATAVAVLRARGRWRPTSWTPLTVAFEAGVVSIALAVPILAGLVFLIVPGVIVALRWSQALFLILDGRAHWFEAARESEELTAGRQLPVLLVWLATGVMVALAAWLASTVGAAGDALARTSTWSAALILVGQVAADVFSLVVLASLYVELDTTGVVL
jgi:hypothetical protein